MRRLLLLVVLVTPFVFSGCIDRETAPDTSQQLALDIEAIDNYITIHNVNAMKDPVGIRIDINQLGTKGLPPKSDQTVVVKYTGGILDGAVFETGTITQPLNKLIAGWQYGLAIMPKGSQFTLYVPSTLAYGNRGVGPIPANANLVFQMELQDVVPSNAEKARLISDIALIDQYIIDHNITNVVSDTTGIRYVITSPGSGAPPTWYESVRFEYNGKLLSTGVSFFSATGQPSDVFASRVVDYIHGLKVALQHLPVGGKMTVYIPSGLAFGNDATSATVPANSNVIYEIELKEIY